MRRGRRPSDFYPRPPRGGRPFCLHTRFHLYAISIHALREEGDPAGAAAATWGHISIHALREEGDVCQFEEDDQVINISIHALREEGDPALLRYVAFAGISIHALREEGDTSIHGMCKAEHKFLSTPSARRATA